MTELEKRAKSIENTKRKYPNVTDENELKELAVKLERKNTFIKSLAMILGGALAVIVSLVITMESLSQIFMIMGGVFVFDGLIMLFSLFKKKKQFHIDISKRTMIDMEYLKAKDKRSNVSTVCKQVIGMGILVTILYGRSDIGAFLLCTLVPLFFIVLYWIFRIIRCNKNNKIIKQEKFKLLNTKLCDKEDETDVGTDAETTHTYYLIFKHQGRYNYKFKKIVKRAEFCKREIGDECSLLLFFNDKKSEYELDSVFWNNETVISSELQKYFATEDEIAETNRYGIHDFRKLKKTTE